MSKLLSESEGLRAARAELEASHASEVQALAEQLRRQAESDQSAALTREVERRESERAAPRACMHVCTPHVHGMGVACVWRVGVACAGGAARVGARGPHHMPGRAVRETSAATHAAPPTVHRPPPAVRSVPSGHR